MNDTANEAKPDCAASRAGEAGANLTNVLGVGMKYIKMAVTLVIAWFLFMSIATGWATGKSRERTACYKEKQCIECCEQPGRFERWIREMNAPNTVVIGEGAHSMKCELTPTRTGQAYAGSVMGRELVYEHSRAQVQADLDRDNPALRQSTRRKT